MPAVSDETVAGAPARVFGEFCTAGLWPGVGRAMAEKLLAAGITGPRDVTPGRLELVEGIGPKRAEKLAASFARARPAYDAAELLAGCRVPARYAGAAVACLGPSAARQLREDPWRLLSLPQIRPDQADWFARALLGDGAHPQDVRRGRALVAHLLARAAREGHTVVRTAAVAAALGRFGIEDPGAAVTAAIDDGSVLPFEAPEQGEDSDDGTGRAGALLALTRYAIAEEAVAEGLQRLAATAEPLPGGPTARARGGAKPAPPAQEDVPPAAGGGELDDRQRAAVAAAAEHGVCVLTGGPGTGKSRTVAAVVSLAAAHGLRVALAAPTGRAAKRLEELTGAPATTLHKLLGAQGRGIQRPAVPGQEGAAQAGASGQDGGAVTGGGAAEGAGEHSVPGDMILDAGPGGAADAESAPGTAGPADAPAGEGSWVFTRGEDWPLDADLVVVDESSMLDVELAAALVEACADGTRLLLVGDPAQLPSIGPGRVLADIIGSGAVPVTELTTLYRQRDGGVIAKLATAVRGGELPPVHSPEREVVIVPARSSAGAARRVVQLVTDSIPRALGITATDIQVVTPVHRGPAGTIELNRMLKQRLNPGPGTYRGFDPGDRVVAIANHAEEGFANGEVGTVTGPADDGLTVVFSGAPVTVPAKLLSDLRHGWALTVHRAQGSEWPAVVAVFPAEASGMLSRPLVYTAITRAQRHLSVVHGAGPALARAVRTIGERPRLTRLTALLRDA
jgi:exodeoxyribonuclease V alpha subunit